MSQQTVKMNEREWLDLYERDKAEFELEMAKVHRPGPHRHKWNKAGYCERCSTYVNEADKNCPIPDPIDSTDWNVAMEAFRAAWPKSDLHLTHCAALLLLTSETAILRWERRLAQPHHYLIAAAVARADHDE